MVHFPYPVTLRILKNYIEVAVPDIPLYKVTKTFDEIKLPSDIGKLVLEVIQEAQQNLNQLKAKKLPEPKPSQPRGCLNPEADLTDPLVSIKQVEQIIQLSIHSIRRLASKGILNPIRTEGNHRRFRMSDVNRYLEKRAQQNSKESRKSIPNEILA